MDRSSNEVNGINEKSESDDGGQYSSGNDGGDASIQGGEFLTRPTKRAAGK